MNRTFRVPLPRAFVMLCVITYAFITVFLFWRFDFGFRYNYLDIILIATSSSLWSA